MEFVRPVSAGRNRLSSVETPISPFEEPQRLYVFFRSSASSDLRGGFESMTKNIDLRFRVFRAVNWLLAPRPVLSDMILFNDKTLSASL
jgi:hypothetical protein